MSCNSCTKRFTLFRKQKGCPSCGFSFCSECLVNKVFVPTLNSEAKVCAKCQQSLQSSKPNKVEPPDAYYKRLEAIRSTSNDKCHSNVAENTKKADEEIAERLQKLKTGKEKPLPPEEEIAERLHKLKGNIMSKTHDIDIQARLDRLKGVPTSINSQPVLIKPDLRSEQEQADDLMRQYLEQTKIDTKYKDEFDEIVDSMASRLDKLKGTEAGSSSKDPKPLEVESEDEETTVMKIVAKVKAEAVLEDDELPNSHDELPFCEICNEDAKMRCLGCRYLFCKRCFLEHKDDDDGCNRYEPYTPPKGFEC